MENMKCCDYSDTSLRGRISEHNGMDHTDVVLGVLPGGQPVQLVGAFPELVIAAPHRKLQTNNQIRRQKLKLVQN
jgi:hypothetical protein